MPIELFLHNNNIQETSIASNRIRSFIILSTKSWSAIVILTAITFVFDKQVKQVNKMTTEIKLGQLKKGKPLLDKDVYGFRINIMRGIGALRGINKADHKLYYDEWWNGRESGNTNFDLAPSKDLYQAFIVSKTITWPEYVKRFTTEIESNTKAHKALDYIAHYQGIITLLCHCVDENKCHRSLVKSMVLDNT
jgi:uncharacterized protein YeaO (DUF488 family)